MTKRVMLASLVIAAAVAPASAEEHQRQFSPKVIPPQAHPLPPPAHPAAPPPQAARPQPPPQAARPQPPPPQAARPQPAPQAAQPHQWEHAHPAAPPPQAARPQPAPQAAQPHQWEHARPQPAPQAAQPQQWEHSRQQPEQYRGRFDEGRHGDYHHDDYARRYEGRRFERPRVDVHHYARRYSRLPDFRVYGSWGLAAPLRAYPDLSFLDDAMLVGSYVWEGRVVYVYLLDEDGEHHELRVDEYGNMLSDDIVP